MNTKGKIVVFLILLVIFGISAFFLTKEPADDLPMGEVNTVLNIEKEDIKEENFSGSKPVISGSGILADEGRKHIETIVSEFKQRADIEVPKMREDFGVESPPATYTLDIDANLEEGSLTRSIIFSEYYYTGGANGMGIYTTITLDKRSETIINLKDIIKEEKQNDFTQLVKDRLIAWRPMDIEESVVFPQDVQNLTFQSFTGWSMNEENLTIYFDKYEIGPGALGAVPFEIPLIELQDFLNIPL